MSHLLLSQLANIFACKPLSLVKIILSSEVEVVLVRSSRTQRHSHWVTLPISSSASVVSVAMPGSYHIRSWETKITNWMKRWNGRCSSTQRHSPPTFISPRKPRGPTSSRLTLHTNTSVAEESAFAATRRAVERSLPVGAGGESPQTTEWAPASPLSTNKPQVENNGGKRPDESGRRTHRQDEGGGRVYDHAVVLNHFHAA